MRNYLSKITLLLLVTNLISCSNIEPKETIATQQKTVLVKTPIAITSALINIQPYDGLSKEITEYIFAELGIVYPTLKLLKYKPLPKRAYYKTRNRYKADTIIAILTQDTKKQGTHSCTYQ